MKYNKEIATFMGGEWEWINIPVMHRDKDATCERVEQCELPFDTLPKSYKNNRFQPKGLYYHEDWNWLMPVIEKCSYWNLEINVTPGKGYHYPFNCFGGWGDHQGYDLNIDFSYKAVVEFIKLYNQVL